MKSKQLANVLIKIIGLYICLDAIPSVVSGILRGMSQMKESPQWLAIIPVVSFGIGAAIQAAVGLFIIAKSQKVAGWMFKSDED